MNVSCVFGGKAFAMEWFQQGPSEHFEDSHAGLFKPWGCQQKGQAMLACRMALIGSQGAPTTRPREVYIVDLSNTMLQVRMCNPTL